LSAFENALTDLAEAVLSQALELCRARLVEGPRPAHAGRRRVCPAAVMGLGKFGGELGYASDLELLVVYQGTGTTEVSGIERELFARLVQDLVETLEAREEDLPHRPPSPASREEGRSGQPLGLLREVLPLRR
jgi:glutamine synthetase adenylyltransferase